MMLYTVMCPKCGDLYTRVVGRTVMEYVEAGEKEVFDRMENPNAPFDCPRCGARINPRRHRFIDPDAPVMFID